MAKAYSVPLLRMEERDDGLLSSLTDLSSHQLAVGSAPVNLITVFGQARQGKSTLMNQLLGQATFKISHGNEPCTVGVDAASVLAPLERFAQQPVATEASNILVGFVDVEGQGDKGQAYDVQLLCPLLLVSRVAIFNWRGKVQKDDLLEKLKVLTAAAEATQPAPSAAGGASTFGHLVILLRDCVDTTGVNELLFSPETGDSEAAEGRNKMRADLKRAFASLRVLSLPPPVNDTELLDAGQWVDTTAEFDAAMRRLRGELTAMLSAAHRLDGRVLTGPAITRLLPVITAALNDKRGQLLPRSLLEESERRAVGQAVASSQAWCEDALQSLMDGGGGPQDPTELSNALAAQRMQCESMYMSATAGIRREIRDEGMEDVSGYAQARVEEVFGINEQRIEAHVRRSKDVAMAAFKDRFGALRTLTPTATLQDSYEQAVRHATRLYDSEVSCCGSAPQASQGLHELRGDFQRQYDAAVLQNTALQKQEEERQLRVQREEAERRQREAERRQREAEEARRQAERARQEAEDRERREAEERANQVVWVPMMTPYGQIIMMPMRRGGG